MRRPAILLLGFAFFALALMPLFPLSEAANTEHIVSGTIDDLQGVGMSGVEVLAARVDNGTIYKGVSGVNGTYIMSLPDGDYNISAAIAGYGSNTTYRMLNVAMDLHDLNLTIQVVTGRVEGHVSSEDAPVLGAQVVLSNPNATYVGLTGLPLGGYSITGVVPGVYVAKSEVAGYWTNVSEDPVFVNAMEITQLDFVLEPQPAHIFGKVTVNEIPEEGVTVSLIANGIEIRVAITDANGNYSFSNIIAGEYQLVFRKEGLVEKTYPLSLSPFEDKELSVSMEPDQTSGDGGFIDGLDLTHSMMVVALIVVVLLMVFAIFVRWQVLKKPELLARDEEEDGASPTEKKEKK